MRISRSCLLKRNAVFSIGVILSTFVLLWLFFSSSFWTSPSAFTRDHARDARFKAAMTSVLHPPTCKGCVFQATGYQSSSLESDWSARVRGEYSKRGLCNVIGTEVGVWQRWLDEVANTRGPELGGIASGSQSMTPSTASDWSYIMYRLEDGTEIKVLLEPLAGFLRDPRNACKDIALQPPLALNSQDSKAHIYLDPVFYRRLAVSLRGSPRAFLFDLGSTKWVTSSSTMPYTGLSWLIKAYEGLGIEFDGIYTWEAKHVHTLEYFSDMPSYLVSRTHFYNAPVAPGVNGNGPQAVMTILKSVASPGDFVVFKLDVDSDYLEEELTLDILELDELCELVDDFFFEHHVDTFGVMERVGWSQGSAYPRDTADSIAMFQALRKRGVRSHSWP